MFTANFFAYYIINNSKFSAIYPLPQSFKSIMQNEDKKNVDLYIPRKCSATNRLIHSKDHASIQLKIGHVDESTGVYNGEYTTIAICGYIRKDSRGDEMINRLMTEHGFLKHSYDFGTDTEY